MYAPYWAASQHGRGASQPATNASLVRTSSSGSGTMPSGSASHTDPPPGLESGAQDCEPVAPVSLATFNCGIDQNMLTGSNLATHQLNLRRIIANALEDKCHVLAFCEVGGHKQGLQAASIVPSEIVKGLLDKDRCIAASLEAYMAVWDQGDLQEQDGIAVQLRFPPTCVELRLGGRDLAVEPRVVIFEFEVTASQHAHKMGRLVLGVLHIRQNKSHQNAVSTKQKVTRQALKELEKRADSGALQPAVCILTGDPNLLPAECDPVIQPETGEADAKKHWYKVSSSAGLNGDVAFIRGAPYKQFELCVGKSYQKLDPGIRHDAHDFFGVVLYMPLFQVPSATEAAQHVAEVTLHEEPREPAQRAAEVTLHDEPRESSERSPSAPAEDLHEPENETRDIPSEPSERCPSAPAKELHEPENEPPVRDDDEEEPAGEAPKPATATPPEKKPRTTPPTTPRDQLLLDELRNWYDDRADLWEEGHKKAWDHLHRFLFRRVKHRLENDKWWTNDLVTVVSKEYVANQVREIIEWREKWLTQRNLDIHTCMNDKQKEDFLRDSKKAFHDRPDQKEQQERDASDHGIRIMKKKMKSRWNLHCQRLGGTQPMWLLLSFTGRFETRFFEDREAPEQQEEANQEQKKATAKAANARGRYRYARNLANKLDNGQRLGSAEMEEVNLYKSGVLLKKANDLTLLSGHGTLRRPGDAAECLIGASTGGIVRRILENWEEPDRRHFLEGDPAAESDERREGWESC